MAEIIHASPVTIIAVQSGGDGGPGSAVAVDLPTAHTIFLVEMPVEGYQAIKLPVGNLGDFAEIFAISGTSTGTNPRLRIYDAEDNIVAQTDASGALSANGYVAARKVLPEAYVAPGGYDTEFVGTWLCPSPTVKSNYPST